MSINQVAIVAQNAHWFGNYQNHSNAIFCIDDEESQLSKFITSFKNFKVLCYFSR